MQYYLFDQNLEPVLPALLPLNIRAIRFGEGCFETMCFRHGKIRLGNLHFKRMLQTSRDLSIDLPENFDLHWLQKFLCHTIDIHHDWRVRLTVYHAGIDLKVNPSPAYIGIEIQPYQEPATHISVSLLHHTQPALYAFSAHKSLNYQLYAFALQTAIEKGVDDVLLINHEYQLIESSVANIFVVKDGQLITPPLTIGCIAGVMREYILTNFEAKEKNITVAELDHCSEIFLSNALGIRSVKEWNGKELKFSIAEKGRKLINN